jgi:hypothetical protein
MARTIEYRITDRAIQEFLATEAPLDSARCRPTDVVNDAEPPISRRTGFWSILTLFENAADRALDFESIRPEY